LMLRSCKPTTTNKDQHETQHRHRHAG
jgi:hypothetical protein